MGDVLGLSGSRVGGLGFRVEGKRKGFRSWVPLVAFAFSRVSLGLAEAPKASDENPGREERLGQTV